MPLTPFALSSWKTLNEASLPRESDSESIADDRTETASVHSDAADTPKPPVSLEPSSSFNSYVSPFPMYPSLSSVSSLSARMPLGRHASLMSGFTHTAQPSPLDSIQNLDLDPLRSRILDGHLDSARRLCAYESGGGTCEDSTCEDIHRKEIDPSDHITADFVAPFLVNFSREQIIIALAHAREKIEKAGHDSLTSHDQPGTDPLRERIVFASKHLLSSS